MCITNGPDVTEESSIRWVCILRASQEGYGKKYPQREVQSIHDLEGELLPALLVSPSQLLLPLSGRYCSLLCEINCLNHLCLSVDQFILSRCKSQGNIDLLTLPKPQEDGVEGPRKLLSAVCLRHSCYTSLSLIPSQSGPSLD